MFDEFIKTVSEKISTVSLKISTIRAIINTNDKLREIVFGQPVDRQQLEENADFRSLIEVVPIKHEWRIYDRCAVVTRLYAVYERFVEDLISEWLRILPEIVSVYSELEERIQNTHREGIGRLLLDLNKKRYKDKNLRADNVVQGLFYGVTGTGKYELLSEAFLLHEQNLRKEVLEKLFADAGIENIWEWVKNHREIKYFIEEVRSNQNTAEGELKQLIDYRNEAAHGSVDEILGTQELLDLSDFIEALCKALAELVTCQVILQKTKKKQAKMIGEISEWFKIPRAAVAIVTKGNLFVGGKSWLIKEESSYCQLLTIESIKLDNIKKEELQINSETEVGLQFNADVMKGMIMYTIT